MPMALWLLEAVTWARAYVRMNRNLSSVSRVYSSSGIRWSMRCSP